MNPGSITFFKGMLGLNYNIFNCSWSLRFKLLLGKEDDKAMNRTKNRPLPSGENL